MSYGSLYLSDLILSEIPSPKYTVVTLAVRTSQVYSQPKYVDVSCVLAGFLLWLRF